MTALQVPRLILVGGGHAHVHVLEALATGKWPPVLPILISPHARQFYSGMVPGYLQGQYSSEEVSIDLAGLCRSAGAEFIEDAAVSLDPAAKEVRTTRGTFGFSLLSLDIGAAVGGMDLPGVHENAVSLRPLAAVVELRRRVDALAGDRSGSGSAVRIGVVGAGAGGVEIAMAVHRRIADRGGRPAVRLVERGSSILPGYARPVQEKTMGLLRGRGIDLLLDREVRAVSPGKIHLAGGGEVDVDIVIWVGGPAPPPPLERSALPRSEAGYLSVDATLRAVDGSPVWGAGDCVDLLGHDLPKAGVYAVRQGPLLAHNLRAALVGEPPRPYRPQSSFLSILNTADGKALLRWRSLRSHSRLAWHLKDRIDRAFVRRFSEVRPAREAR